MAIKHKGYHANSFSQLITMNCWGQVMIATFCSQSKKILSVKTRWNGVKTRWNGAKKIKFESDPVQSFGVLNRSGYMMSWMDEKNSVKPLRTIGADPKKRQLETNIDKQSLMCLEKIFIMICCFAKKLWHFMIAGCIWFQGFLFSVGFSWPKSNGRRASEQFMVGWNLDLLAQLQDV